MREKSIKVGEIILYPNPPYDLNKYIQVLGDFASDGVNIFKKTNLLGKAYYFLSSLRRPS